MLAVKPEDFGELIEDRILCSKKRMSSFVILLIFLMEKNWAFVNCRQSNSSYRMVEVKSLNRCYLKERLKILNCHVSDKEESSKKKLGLFIYL